MDILYLAIVFLVIVAVIWGRKPLYVAMVGGIVATVLLFRINPLTAAELLVRQTLSWETVDLLLSFYLIMFLQLMLEKKGRLANAKDAFNRLFRNRRMNTIVPPAIVGLLPSAAVMTICADMVDKTCESYLDNKSKTFVSCFYRHIPEMFLPTFPVILLGVSLSGQNMGLYVLLMVPLVITACAIVNFTYLRKIPKEMPPLEGGAVDKKAEVTNLFKNLWTLLAVLVIIIVCNVSVCFAAPPIILINFFADRFDVKELPDLIVRSAEPVLLSNMYMIMLFKAILSYTGVLGLLPTFFSQFPISLMMAFALLFFFGTVISGSQAIVALCMPMAYLAFPDGGIPLLVTLMGIAWAAMQISPTHVCAFVAAEYYHTTLGDIVVKALPSVILFCVVTYLYGMALGMVF